MFHPVYHDLNAAIHKHDRLQPQNFSNTPFQFHLEHLLQGPDYNRYFSQPSLVYFLSICTDPRKSIFKLRRHSWLASGHVAVQATSPEHHRHHAAVNPYDAVLLNKSARDSALKGTAACSRVGCDPLVGMVTALQRLSTNSLHTLTLFSC